MSDEPFAKAEAILDEIEADMKSKQMRDESLVFTGQLMANLLYWFKNELEGDPKFDQKCKEAQELITRWEKEFK